MNPLSAYGLKLTSALSKLAAGSFRLGMETSFQSIQTTAIKRMNDEIDKVIANDDTPRKLANLEREYRVLEKNKVTIDAFAFDTQSNLLRLVRMNSDVSDAIAAFSDVDDETNLTADEVATLTAKRDALISDTQALLLTVHSDISTPFIIRDVKNYLTTLKDINPVVGVVDPAGTTTPTNDNRSILDTLTTFSGLLSTAQTVADTTAETAFNMSLDTQAVLASKLSDMSELSDVELQKRQDEIDTIKTKYGNMLRSISLSFEARAQSLEKMTGALGEQEIPLGSIMNLFT